MARPAQLQGKPGIQPVIKTEPSSANETSEKPTIETSISEDENISQPSAADKENAEETSEPRLEDKEAQRTVQKKKFSYEED